MRPGEPFEAVDYPQALGGARAYRRGLASPQP